MLDINVIRQNPEEVVDMLRRRQLSSEEPKLAELLALDKKRKELVQHSDEQKALRNKVSKEIAEIKKSGQGSGDDLIIEMKRVSEDIAVMDTILSSLEEDIENILLCLPNMLHHSVPAGRSAEDNEVFKEPVNFEHDLSFPVKNHLELGKSLGILDFERGAKVAGAGFPAYFGKGARLERALINFMLDLHTEKHGYTEVFPPFFVNQESLRGRIRSGAYAQACEHLLCHASGYSRRCTSSEAD